MNRFVASICLVLFPLYAMGQSAKYRTSAGHIYFMSEAPLEKIEAHNHQVAAIFDAGSRALAYKVIMKSFEFEKAAMEDHFNRNYLHSDTYPNATFEGSLTEGSVIDLRKDGEYPVEVEGKLSIHGVSKEIRAKGVFVVLGKSIRTKSVFRILLSDYKVRIPSNYINNISKEIEINVDCLLELR